MSTYPQREKPIKHHTVLPTNNQRSTNKCWRVCTLQEAM